MPIDPNLAFGFKPTPNVGPDLGAALQDAQRMYALQATGQQNQSQNALKGILGAPGAVDDQGNPTPDAMKKIMAVDPATGMQVRQNMLVQQQHQEQLRTSQLKRQQELSDLAEPIRIEAYRVYNETPGDAAAKQAAAQKVYAERTGELKAGGGVSSEEAALMPGSFDINRIISNSPTIQADLAKQRREEIEERRIAATEANQQAEREQGKRRLDIAQESVEQGRYTWQPGQGPGPDGNQVAGSWRYPAKGDGDPTFFPGVLREAKTSAAERDVEAIANDKIAKEEKETGAPLSDARKAAIRQQARIDPKVTEATEKQQAKPAAADHAGVEADITKEHPDWSAGQVALEAKKREKAAASGEIITDEAASLAAERVLSGDSRATVGMARSAANIAKVTNEVARLAKERGMTGADVTRRVAEFTGTLSGERTLGTRSANMEIAANEVKNMAPLALSASSKVNRTQYPTLNGILLAAEKGTGGEDVVRFGLAANSLIYTYSKFLNPTGIPTDADKAKATEILSTAWSKGQFAAAIDQIKKEIASGQAALKTAREDVGEGISGATRGEPKTSEDTKAATQKTDEGGSADKRSAAAIPPAAVELLKSKPAMAAAFDAKYGAGEAAKILGNGAGKKAATTTPEAAKTATTAEPPAGLPQGARQAKDGKWYVPDGKGGWLRAVQAGN